MHPKPPTSVGDDYNDTSFLTLDEAQLREYVRGELRCPIDWSSFGLPGAMEELVLELWAKTVAQLLPDSDDDWYLQDRAGHLSEPDESSIGWVEMDVDEARALANNLRDLRGSHRARYRELCRPLVSMHAIGVKRRKKHHALPRLSSQEIAARSLLSPEESLLLPFVTPSVQMTCFWDAMAELFENRRTEIEERSYIEARNQAGAAGLSPFLDHEAAAFQKAWDLVFGRSHLRVSINTFDVVGYHCGDEAAWLILDIDFDTPNLHAYASTAPLDAAWSVDRDAFQGAKVTFDRGEPVNWLDRNSE